MQSRALSGTDTHIARHMVGGHVDGRGATALVWLAADKVR